MPAKWDWDFVTVPFLLASMTMAAVLGLFFMSYMSSEEESAGAWLAHDILKRGGPRDARELQRRRAAKMQRLINEKIRVATPKRSASSSSKDTASAAAATATGTAAEAAKARHRKDRAENEAPAAGETASEAKKGR